MALSGAGYLSPNPAGGNNSQLYAISGTATNDIWVAGQTLTMHWNGTAWSIINNPVPGSAEYSSLYAVEAHAANDVWAVGDYQEVQTFYTLIEHWDGTQWSIVPSPNSTAPNNFLGDVDIVSASDVWAVGSSSDTFFTTSSTLVEHWDGTQWSIVAAPSPGTSASLSAVTAISTNDVWAVGSHSDTSSSGTLTMRWDGAQWSVVPSPNVGPHPGALNAVAAVSSDELWAVGANYGDFSHSFTLTEHYLTSCVPFTPTPTPMPDRA